MALYHSQIFMPNFKFPRGIFDLTYSDHAIKESRNDRYGHIPLPAKINTYQTRIIEVETDANGVMIKILYKVKLTDNKSLVMAIALDNNRFHVKTVWINKADDTHKTLDKSKYKVA
jgi:hypothetical protein